MAKCVPIRELKNTGRFAETVRSSDGPVTVTRNGMDAMVAMSPEYWEGVQLQLAKADLFARIQLAEREIAGSDYDDIKTAMGRLMEKHGL